MAHAIELTVTGHETIALLQLVVACEDLLQVLALDGIDGRRQYIPQLSQTLTQLGVASGWVTGVCANASAICA